MQYGNLHSNDMMNACYSKHRITMHDERFLCAHFLLYSANRKFCSEVMYSSGKMFKANDSDLIA